MAGRARDRPHRALGSRQPPGPRDGVGEDPRRPARRPDRPGAGRGRAGHRDRRRRGPHRQRRPDRADLGRGPAQVHRRVRCRAPGRDDPALHRAADPAVLQRGRRHASLRGAVHRARGRALLRPRPAPARAPRPEGRGRRAGPAQHRGLHPVPAVQPGLRVPVEPPGDRPGRARHHGHPLGVRGHPAVGLLDHRGGRARRRDPRLQRRGRPRADAARVGVRVLAVQAPLQDPGRAAGRGARVQAPRAADLGHRHRLLPLDPAG